MSAELKFWTTKILLVHSGLACVPISTELKRAYGNHAGRKWCHHCCDLYWGISEHISGCRCLLQTLCWLGYAWAASPLSVKPQCKAVCFCSCGDGMRLEEVIYDSCANGCGKVMLWAGKLDSFSFSMTPARWRETRVSRQQECVVVDSLGSNRRQLQIPYVRCII